MTPERQNEIWAMLTHAEKEEISKWYSNNYGSTVPLNVGFQTTLLEIFGHDNLTSQTEEKQKEQKFKVWDKVLYNGMEMVILQFNQVEGNYRYYASDNIARAYWYDEDELTPYTEPKEDEKISTKEDAYFAYRLDLAKDIAVAMIGKWSNADFIPHDSVQMANEIVKRLKETDNAY